MADSPDTQSEPSAGKGFNLVMTLEDPSKLPELLQKLEAHGTKENIQAALRSLDYVHYARFLPLWDHGVLMIITEFDGAVEDYVMDFAAVLNEEFSLILSYMRGRPPLPIRDHPAEFWEYVERNIQPPSPLPKYREPFSPYADRSVLEVLGNERSKSLPKPPVEAGDDPPVDLEDVQANMLRGYRADCAAHVGLVFASPARGREFLQALEKDDRIRVTPAARLRAEQRPDACVNLGLTHAGLEALGVPFEVLQRFPRAFREGPRLRAAKLGDEGPSDPTRWRIGGIRNGVPCTVHAVVSIYARQTHELEQALGHLESLIAAESSGVKLAFPIERTAALDREGTVHFGYRDSISQPRIKGVSEPERGRTQPFSPAGDFLLGPQFRNSRGGLYIGELPVELAQNATYAAMRVIEQHTTEFEQFLDRVYAEQGIDRELLAAKMMGRWRGSGLPLATTPAPPHGLSAAGCPIKPPLGAPELNDFDYDGPNAEFKDLQGKRCPVGAHIRRLHPRGGMVVGIPWGRRVIRRGMPYGPAYDPVHRTDEARGLIGMFICGDLESQYEFLQRVWANQDLSAPGIRHTRDPFGATRSAATPFRFFPSEAARQEVTVEVPPLTRTDGSLYLMVPGLSGLAWIARGGWNTNVSDAARGRPADTPPHRASSQSTSGRGAPVDISKFDPSDPLFHANPYPYYAAMRAVSPVRKIEAPYDSFWVTSHALVKEVCENKAVFLKPGNNREKSVGPFAAASQFGDGLFFMDPPRHGEVRKIMEEAFATAIEGAEVYAREIADAVLAKAVKKGTMDLVADFAAEVPMRVFMKVMGIPSPTAQQAASEVPDSFVFDRWNRATLEAHDPSAPLPTRIAGGTSNLALRAYLLAHALETPLATPVGCLSLMGGMKAHTGCPASATTMSPFEAMNTAAHFALGGYLSTEFLLSTGVYTLLRHPDQWNRLRDNPGDVKLLRNAVHEMLRFEAPFQMADRWVEQGTRLAEARIPAGSKVTVVYGAANRDPAVFEDPDRFDIERKNAESPDNFGFGHGIHYCIGEPLAVKVATVALQALLEHCPAPRIDAVGSWSSDPFFRTLKQLNVFLR
jgi:cytochrome P450/deferrochelatase/peroxidase EfeB